MHGKIGPRSVTVCVGKGRAILLTSAAYCLVANQLVTLKRDYTKSELASHLYAPYDLLEACNRGTPGPFTGKLENPEKGQIISLGDSLSLQTQ